MLIIASLSVARSCDIASLWSIMPTADDLQRRIEDAIPDASAQVIDLTGGGDHFRAQVISPAFEGMSRIAQHRLVYDVFGDEVGGPIHALSITTRTSQ
jgi:stress-induced morphogen